MCSVKKASQKVFEKYQYLAEQSARKIFSYEELSYELEDLIQELKIKLWQSIKAYGRRYLAYQRGEAVKPVPLKYYLATTMANRSKDIMKQISRSNNKVRIDDISYDYGVVDDTRISPEKNTFILRDVDLLEGLSGIDRSTFSMYLRGYNIGTIRRYNKQASEVIKRQRQHIIDNYSDVLLKNSTIFSTFCLDD